MRKYIIPFAAATLLSQSLAFADEGIEKRFALVIGNQSYSNPTVYTNLESAGKDADEMKNFLSKEAGFKVYSVKNASKRQMELALENFKQVLSDNSGSVGLVYYSGHGIQPSKKSDNDESYIAPVDANDKVESHFPTSKIYQALNEAGTKGNLVFLDACRSNQAPTQDGQKGGRVFKSAKGEIKAVEGVGSQVAFLPRNTLVGYATAPKEFATSGETASQASVYTTNLLKTLARPNLKLVEIMNLVKDNASDSDQKNTYHTGENVNDFLTSFRFISTNSTTTGWSQ